jgi:hypothetical protein
LEIPLQREKKFWEKLGELEVFMNMKRIIRLSESDLVGLVNKVIKEQKKEKLSNKFNYWEDPGSLMIRFGDSKYVQEILNQLPRNIKFLAINDSEYADFSGINICDYPELLFVNVKGTENNLEELNFDCLRIFHGDKGIFERIQVDKPEPSIYQDDKTKTLPYHKGLSMNEGMKRKK